MEDEKLFVEGNSNLPPFKINPNTRITRVSDSSKGRYIQCDSYLTILLCYFDETKEIIYESLNLKGHLNNLSHRVNGPLKLGSHKS